MSRSTHAKPSKTHHRNDPRAKRCDTSFLESAGNNADCASEDSRLRFKARAGRGGKLRDTITQGGTRSSNGNYQRSTGHSFCIYYGTVMSKPATVVSLFTAQEVQETTMEVCPPIATQWPETQLSPTHVDSVEPILVSSIPSQLPYLPEPLKLRHGPISITIETWSDGTVAASIPSLALYATADSDTLAISDLADEILSFAVGVQELLDKGGKIAGPLQRQWAGLSEFVDVTALSKRD